MIELYSICSLIVGIDLISTNYLPFAIEKTVAHEIDLRITHKDNSLTITSVIRKARLSTMLVFQEHISDKEYRWIYQASNGMFTLVVNEGYDNAEYYYLDSLDYFYKNEITKIFNPYIQILLECKLIQHGFLILHSSCVEVAGLAYAFTGPSGIGKSSRAKKWCDLLSAKWISGDRPAIEVEKGKAYGVPWDGKESIFKNINYPLAAILKVKRSNSTYLRIMSEQEKIQLLCEQCFFPLWDPMLATTALHSVKLLVKKVSIFELCCDITDESTYESYNIIKNTILKSQRK